jgi:hypothetical protein
MCYKRANSVNKKLTPMGVKTGRIVMKVRSACIGSTFYVLLLSFTLTYAKPVPADPLDLDVLDSTRAVPATSIELYQGTITNNTGADVMASDLFFNFFGFDPQFVSLTQLLGAPDFTISNGATSPVVDLFDFTLGPNAPPGLYSSDVLLEDSVGDTSNIVTVTGQVPEPAAGSLLAISILSFMLCCSLREITRRLKIGAKSALVLVTVPFLLQSTVSYADPPVIFVTGVPGLSSEGSTTLHSALPIQNNGTVAAQNVQITSIQLHGGARVAPALPASLGSIAPGGLAVLLADFTGGSFVPGGRYLLTLSGTYIVGGTTYGFSLNRALIVPAAAGPGRTKTITVFPSTVSPGGYPPGSPPNEEANPGGRPVPNGPISTVPPQHLYR